MEKRDLNLLEFMEFMIYPIKGPMTIKGNKESPFEIFFTPL
jgi:hypothetical protein